MYCRTTFVNIEEKLVEEKTNEPVHWLHEYFAKEENQKQEEKTKNAKAMEKEEKKENKLNIKESEEVFLECQDEKTKGTKRNGDIIEKEAKKTKETHDINSQISEEEETNNFNGFIYNNFKPTTELSEQISSKMKAVEEFSDESRKYIINRKSIGECKVYAAIKKEQHKINSVTKCLKRADMLEKEAKENMIGKSYEQREEIGLEAAQQLSQLEHIMKEKLKTINNRDLEDFTKEIKKKNEAMNFKSIHANRTFNSSFMSESKKEKKLYNYLFVGKKLKKETMPEFSSQGNFDPNEKRKNKKSSYKPPKITADMYYQKYRKPGEVPHYDGKTMPLLGTKVEAVKKEKQKVTINDCYDIIDDSFEEINENTDPFKYKHDPWKNINHEMEPATLKQIINSPSLEDNAERFRILENHVKGVAGYLQYIRHPENVFKNWKPFKNY